MDIFKNLLLISVLCIDDLDSSKSVDNGITLLAGMGSYKCGKKISAEEFRIAVFITNPDLKAYEVGEVIKIKSESLDPDFRFVKEKSKKLGPITDLALDQIQNMKNRGDLRGLANYSLRIFFSEINKVNDLQTVTARFFHFILDEPVHAFIGPDSIIPLGTIARIAGTRFNRSLVSLGQAGYQYEFKNKVEYQGLTRIAGNHESLTNFMGKVMRFYKWLPRKYKNIGVFYLDEGAYSDNFYIAKEMMERLKDYRIEGYKSNVKDLNDNREKLKLLALMSRIIIVCGSAAHVRSLMLRAVETKLHLPEFVFIHIDLFTKFSPTPWFDSKASDAENKIAQNAFRQMLIVKLPLNTQYWNSSLGVKLRKIASNNYNYAYPEEELNYVTTSFYESIILYALALNDTFANNDTIEHITNYMWNRTFYGFMAPVKIDAEGNRVSDFSLFDMNPKTFQFTQVGFYNGSTDTYSLIRGTQIDWGNDNNQPPLDTPICDFDGSKCQKNALNIGLILGGVIVAFFVMAIIGGFFTYRHLKFQAELKVMNWIIPWEALETYEKRKHRQSQISRKESYINETMFDGDKKAEKKAQKKKKSDINMSVSKEKYEMETFHLLSSSQKAEFDMDPMIAIRNGNHRGSLSNDSYMSLVTISGIQFEHIQNTQVYIKNALYKGNIVALKKINITRKIEPTMEMLLEIKKIRDLNNDHICRFIGVCLDLNHQYIIYEYCPKGSLEDLLENDQINLDWMFRFSLIQDIIRGMIYLHSNYGCHGHLKSSNCVVDSRFVLKLTDFGLLNLRDSQKDSSNDEQSHEFYKRLLWTSPELLRSPTYPAIGTFKGDVYSFAIIAQEIIYRRGVFAMDNYENRDPKETVELVKSFRSVPFRPSLEAMDGCSTELVKIIKQAWDEDPNARPDFVTIKNLMRKMEKGKESGNILDNLLLRMEQYANNLEGLVAQRTQEYLDEKKKAEDLLYSMLPKSVAHQLIKTKSVSAESYEQVTIYFSDIVGFTSLSADSTPMQVIELLNRLYTTFDSIIENFDVYKVETIGDAYMVVSGLPKLNGKLHAREIARMCLRFLSAIFRFVIPHRPNTQLKLRIGVHSGPVCAGVVGHKMPRYCLFGDTVNTSSRMESNGLPLKIHISHTTMEVLRTFQTFIMTERGEVEMKGKGKQQTYWLHGENDEIVDPLPPNPNIVLCS